MRPRRRKIVLSKSGRTERTIVVFKATKKESGRRRGEKFVGAEYL